MTDALPPADLLDHAQFVRRLAKALLRDDADADDAAQETIARAIERPPRCGPGLSAWFTTVLRNVIRKERRSTARREAREGIAAKREALSGAHEVAAREEVLRVVIDAIRSLEREAREVVLLRYYEDLPPRVIAARLSIPVETVRSRLRRAHERLRARLDEGRGGNVEGWRSALATVLGYDGSPAEVGPLGGGLGMGAAMRVSIGLAAAALVAGGTWVVASALSSSPRAPSPALTVCLGHAEPVPTSAPGLAAHSPPAALAPPALPSGTPADPPNGVATGLVRVRGEIKREDGAKVEDGVVSFKTNDGSHVWFRTGDEATPWADSSGAVAAGRFECVFPSAGTYAVESLRLGAEAVPVEALAEAAYEIRDGDSLTLVLQRPRPAVLIIVDGSTGVPLSDAFAFRHVEEWVERDGCRWLVPLADSPNPGSHAGPRVTADATGRISVAPGWGTSLVHVGAPDHVWKAVHAPHVGEGLPLRVELDAAGALDLTVRGWSGATGLYVSGETPGGALPSFRLLLDATGHGREDGLRVGTWHIHVGREVRDQNVLTAVVETSATCQIRAGETTPVVLTIRPQPGEGEEPVLVTGSLRVPQAWGLDRVTVSFRGRSAPAQVDLPEDGAPASYSVSGVTPGSNVAELSGAKWSWRLPVLVPSSGGRIDLDVPEPALVVVTVLDATTREEVKDAEVVCFTGNWSRARAGQEPAEPVHMTTWYATHDAAKHAYVLRIPSGADGLVEVEAEGYDDADMDTAFHVTGDATKIIRREVLLKTAGKIAVHVRVDGKPFPVPSVFLTRAEEPNPDPRFTPSDARGGQQMEWSTLHPGRWKVTIPPIAGFLPSEPREVNVVAGRTTDVVFDLRRKP